MNAAFLLVTTWITGAGQAPATTVAPPSTAGAPLTSVPIASAPITSAPGGPVGSCCGGGGGYGGAAAACGDCGSCCEMSCGGGGGFFGRFRGGHHKGGGDCGCCDGGYAPVVDCCDTCGGGGGGFFSRFRGGRHKGGYDCGCDCGAVSDGGCCSSSGGLFSRFRHHKRGGDCGCDIGCDGCDGCGGPGYGGAPAPLSHAPYGAVQPYGTGITPYGTPGTMPPAGEPIKLPKDATTPSKKLPSGGTSRQVAPPPLEAVPSASKTNETETKVRPESSSIDPRAPSTSKTNETETKSPFELDRRYETRVERAADYSWLTGQLFYVHADGGLWVLRYAPLGKEDPNGGSVVLARDRQMDSYREGDLVTVHGAILSSKGSPYLGGPLYRAQSIQLVDRPQHVNP